jgi:hypothetical protein
MDVYLFLSIFLKNAQNFLDTLIHTYNKLKKYRNAVKQELIAIYYTGCLITSVV